MNEWKFGNEKFDTAISKISIFPLAGDTIRYNYQIDISIFSIYQSSTNVMGYGCRTQAYNGCSLSWPSVGCADADKYRCTSFSCVYWCINKLVFPTPSVDVRLIIITALQHHATGDDRNPITDRSWVPDGLFAVQQRRRTLFIPPAGLFNCGAVLCRPPIVVDVKRAKLHPVWLPNAPVPGVVVVESVTGVTIVTGHMQSVSVVLRFDGHILILSPQPLKSRVQLHFNT